MSSSLAGVADRALALTASQAMGCGRCRQTFELHLETRQEQRMLPEYKMGTDKQAVCCRSVLVLALLLAPMLHIVSSGQASHLDCGWLSGLLAPVLLATAHRPG